MAEDSVLASPREEQFRCELVESLTRHAMICTPPVERAFRAVARHVFLPDVPLERAYAHESVVTHRDINGVAVSSASAPGVVASMLEQLDVRPGHRVLEIGSGTGYNAALLTHLVGPTGQVTTVDIIEDVVRSARSRLDEAGCGNVTVICGDGAFGYPAHAPYDRIIVTAGAWDLPPAWANQLAPGGRLVVPLRMRGLTRSIAFELEGGSWRSRSIDECGFIPMRGADGVPERNIFLGETGGVLLRVDDRQPVDEDTLQRALDYPATVIWTGSTCPGGVFEHLDFWLANLDGFCRIIVRDDPADLGLVTPRYPWGSMGAIDGGTFAYLTRRRINEVGEASELGVCAYGPDAHKVAQKVADTVTEWEQVRSQLAGLWIEARPHRAEDVPDGEIVITKKHVQVIIHTTAPSGMSA